MTRRILLDTSSYQGNVDFVSLKRRFPEIAGAIIKATEGAWQWTNPNFDAQVASGKQAGIALGFYTFEHPGIADQSDAQLFLNRIAGQNPQLGVWLDAEANDQLPAGVILPRLLGDANYIAAHYPMKTGFYTADWWWGPNTIGSVAAHMENWPLWVAGYIAQLPQLPVPWQHALMWQFTDNYMGTGIDASLFLGSDAAWEWMVTGHVPGPVPIPPPLIVTIAKGIQRALHAVVDGIFGPDTDRRGEGVRIMRSPAQHADHVKVRYCQQVMAFGGSAADGIFGPITQSHWTQTVKQIQSALGVIPDGLWGEITDRAYLKEDPLR